jgi:mannosyltransferase OCH1-like enzyme
MDISPIPRHIYQTWHTKRLPAKMRECVESLCADNPEFEHHLFDDADCREFINHHYGRIILNAYDSLIPGAYKADLWRYCVLFKLGGVYLDIKYRCVDGFKLVSMMDEEHFVKDRDGENSELRIYNAFMVCRAQNEIMRKCIIQVVENVRTKFYGKTALYPTGPSMMSPFFSPVQVQKLEDLQMHSDDITYYIRHKNIDILTTYPEYREDQLRTQVTKYYNILWKEHNIYEQSLLSRDANMSKFKFS